MSEDAEFGLNFPFFFLSSFCVFFRKRRSGLLGGMLGGEDVMDKEVGLNLKETKKRQTL